MVRGRAYRGGTYGKASPQEMERHVYGNLGKPRRGVVVGPGRGLDNAVVSLPGGGVLILTTDPISMIPAEGARLSAWLGVHLVASDLTSSGVDPEYATFSYNFPREMTPRQKEEYLREVGEECARLGVSVVAGNTGTYPGGGFTVIGSGTMMGMAKGDGYVTPAMARAGDRVLITKEAAIEAVSSLAYSFPRTIAASSGEGVLARARRMARLCSTVGDARAARRAGLGGGGVTSMHDATEGGVLGGLDEMASASRKRYVVDPAKIPVSRTAAAVCRRFGLDPLRTMGEGALLLTCSPGSVGRLERAMSEAGIAVNEIGSVEPGEGVVLSTPGGRRSRFVGGEDGYWRAYARATARALR